MRVEIVEKLPEISWETREVAKDSPENRALQGFLSTARSEDSLFSVECPGFGAVHDAGQSSEVYCGDFIIRFRSPEDARNKGLHFTFLEKLSELFRNAGSAATLALKLSVINERLSDESKGGLALGLRLEATGDSVEQAELRWGLGLAHVQQGLLFASRWLRQKSGSRAN